MLDDKARAMLGDHEAAERLTERGELLECPGCGGNDLKEHYVCGDHFVACKACGWTGPMKNSPTEARLAWNTRVPILTAEQIVAVERMEGQSANLTNKEDEK